MNIKVIEDDPKQQALLDGYIKKILAEKNITYSISYYDNAERFLEEYKKPTSIVFMDIQLVGQMNGMDCARRLRTIDDDVILIFVTNMAQFAIQGYEVDATDFIVKPLNYYSFAMKFEKALRILARKTPSKTILLNIDNKNVSLSSQDILYIEVINHDLYIHTLNDKHHIRSSMRKAIDELDGLPFSRCHASYLVNLTYVTSATKNEIRLSDGESLPISRARRNEFLDDFSKYLSGGDK